MSNGASASIEAVRALLGRLLAGALPEEPDWTTLGPWAPDLRGVWTAYQEAGPRGARRAYDALTRRQPVLGVLSDQETDPYPPPVPTDPKLLRELDEPYPCTHAGQAEVLAHLYEGRLLYVPGLGWQIWNGQRWRPDDLGIIQQYAITAARAKQQAVLARTLPEGDRETEKRWAADIRWAKRAEDARPLASTLELAQSLRGFSLRADALDAHDHLLGVSNGVVDLRTGTLRPGEPRDLITLSTRVPYYAAARAPRWARFLAEVFDGDDALIAYIQRAAGYSLTGSTAEQCYFQCWGAGANGKSTLLNLLQAVAGEYAQNTPFSTFDQDRRSDNSADLADLRAARLVLSSESSDTTRLNEARIKAVTGGEQIKARHLYQAYMTYQPRFKIWLASNHKPVIRGTDEGIWRRIRLIPFTVSFKGRADKHLDAELRAELPGILAWAVRGAVEWYRRGALDEPQIVRDATLEYRTESDVLGIFLSECTVSSPGRIVRARQLYEAYKAWAEENSIKPISGVMFGKRMAERGLRQRRTKLGNEWLGIGLVSDHAEIEVADDDDHQTTPLLL